MKAGSVCFASTCFIKGMGGEARNTADNTDATLQKKPMVTEMTPIHGVALQAPLRASCARVLCMICKIPLLTFLDTLGFEEEKWLFTVGALVGTLALKTVVVTTLAEA